MVRMSALVGELVVFDGSGSFDLDGTIVTFEWDFGDGSTGGGVAESYVFVGGAVCGVVDGDRRWWIVGYRDVVG